jgi:hypothetical protein
MPNQSIPAEGIERGSILLWTLSVSEASKMNISRYKNIVLKERSSKLIKNKFWTAQSL